MPGPDPQASALQNAISIGRSLLGEPVFKNLLKGVLSEPLKVDFASTIPNDESVAEFVARRLNPDVADNLVSAVLHGVYAGDIDQLSAQAVMGGIRTFETVERGVIGSLLHLQTSDLKIMRMDELLALETAGTDQPDMYWKTLRTLVSRASVLTFKNGVGQLADSLVAALHKSDKVDVKTNADVSAISQNPETSDLIVS